jgi:glycosyltransferase involved in cell wall biosynthesis
MRNTGRVDPTVIAAIPWFPGAYRNLAQVPDADSVLDIPILHPRYFNVPRIGMRMQPWSLARAILATLYARNMGRDTFDVIDAHYFYPDGVAAATVARALDLPLVISARGSDVNVIGNIRFARDRMVAVAGRAKAIIAVSGALRNRMVELGMPATCMHVLRNGVDADIFFPEPHVQARRYLELTESDAWILAVGNLVAEKGFDLLIEAVSKMRDARVLIVGEGPLGGSLRRLAAERAPGRVVFRNNMPQAELRFAYSACDVLALPSLREGWPNVVLEALACGTPVVASGVGGVPEMLGAQAPGAVVSERRAETWASALDAMLEAGLDRGEVRRYALRFGWDEIVDQQCAVYERIQERPVDTTEEAIA